jgi:hypothetical protein
VKVHREIRKLVPEGWRISLTRGGHLRLQSPSGRPVFCASTPSDYRAFKNIEREIRRVQREDAADPARIAGILEDRVSQGPPAPVAQA